MGIGARGARLASKAPEFAFESEAAAVHVQNRGSVCSAVLRQIVNECSEESLHVSGPQLVVFSVEFVEEVAPAVPELPHSIHPSAMEPSRQLVAALLG